MLKELHATSSGIKCLLSVVVSEQIEECRRACGGHGYSASSGLTNLWTECVHFVTAEGEYYILAQQTAFYLLSELSQIILKKGNTVVENIQYLVRPYSKGVRSYITKIEDLLNLNTLLDAFEHRSRRLCYQIVFQFLQAQANGEDRRTIINRHVLRLADMSKAHCLKILLHRFIVEIESVDSTDQGILRKLACLFAIYFINRDLSEFTIDGYFKEPQVLLIQECLILVYIILQNFYCFFSSLIR